MFSTRAICIACFYHCGEVARDTMHSEPKSVNTPTLISCQIRQPIGGEIMKLKFSHMCLASYIMVPPQPAQKNCQIGPKRWDTNRRDYLIQRLTEARTGLDGQYEKETWKKIAYDINATFGCKMTWVNVACQYLKVSS
jgi:hypothetical protein